MKIAFVKEKRWQRLLTVVVMLFTFGSLARADADLVVVGAGYGHYEGTLPTGVDAVVRHLTGTESADNDRCWVDVRNIGDAEISRNGDDGADAAKLGIEFWIELNGNKINSWNDMGTWSVSANKTVRFYANGHPDGGSFNLFSSLNGTTELKIEIGQGTNLGITKRQCYVNVTKNSDNSGVTFGTNNFYEEYKPSYKVTITDENGVSNEVDVTALKGVLADGNVDEDNPGDFNRPYPLVQGNYYDFGKAPVGVYATRSVLWDRFDVDGKTIFRFKGITANYRIQKVTKLTHRLDYNNNPIPPVDFTTHTFLKVEPLNKAFAEKSIDWNVKNSTRTENFQNRDEVFPNFRNTNDDNVWGYGCLYIAGSGFGYGEYDKYKGWDARWKPDGSDEKYTMFDNHMWVPSPEKNLYKFRLKGGENISNDKNNGFNVKFFLNNYAKKFTGTDQGNWFDYDLENSWRGGNVTTNRDHDDNWNSKNYPYLMHLAATRDFFEITENIPEPNSDNAEKRDSPDWRNGNFQTRKIGFDSDTPALPEGYIFEITLDLRDEENNGPDKWKAHDGENGAKVNGVQVTVERIKDAFALSYVNLAMVSYEEGKNQNEDIHYNIDATDGTTTCEVFLSKFNKTQKNYADKDVTKRLKLRDALRFDYGIPYAKQYVATTSKETEETDEFKAKLNDVLKFKKLIINGALDIEDMQYLSWLAKKNKLITLDLSNAILPSGKIPGPVVIDQEPGVTNFGGESESLTHVIMPAEGVNSVGEKAFQNCKKLENVKEIVEKVHGNIYDSAFENCELTTELDVKNVTSIGNRAFAGCVNLKKVTVPATVTGKDIAGSAVEVGERWKDNNVSLNSDNSSNTIEAEWFNAGNYKGYMKASSEHYKQGDDTYRAQENIGNLGIKSGTNKYSAGRNIGWNEAGAYYNYTFTVTNPGWYKFGAKYGSGSEGDKALTATFDNDTDTKIGVSFNNTNTGEGAWDKGNWDWHDNDTKFVYLTGGDHVMKIDVTAGGLELDAYRLQYVNNENIPTTGTEITDAKSKETFAGVPANNCEVVFTGSDEESNWASYRKQDGWMSLLKKTMDENAAYDCVNQRHADVEVTRTFGAYIDNAQHHNNWFSIVLPFDVKAADLINARAKATDDEKAAYDKYVFDRAAVVDQSSFNREGYPNVHFSYLNSTPFLANVNHYGGKTENALDNNTTYEIGDVFDINGTKLEYVLENEKRVPNTSSSDNVVKAGVPFIVRIDATDRGQNEGFVLFKNVKFYDVRTYPSTYKEHGEDTEGEYVWNRALTTDVKKENGPTLFQFKGNLYDPKCNINTGDDDTKKIWYLSGKWYKGGNTNSTLKIMRSYFQPLSEAGAKLIARLVNGGGTTGIADIEVDGNVNGNIYNLNGQLVRKDGSMQGLPKGVFIINGKRVVIK